MTPFPPFSTHTDGLRTMEQEEEQSELGELFTHEEIPIVPARLKRLTNRLAELERKARRDRNRIRELEEVNKSVRSTITLVAIMVLLLLAINLYSTFKKESGNAASS